MEWLEIIQLRTSERNRALLETLLLELVEDVIRATEGQAIKAYSRVMPHADYGIHLLHDSDSAESSGSQLGLRIASELRAYGIVNHSIWVAAHGS
jgi:hypothetical protein